MYGQQMIDNSEAYHLILQLKNSKTGHRSNNSKKCYSNLKAYMLLLLWRPI